MEFRFNLNEMFQHPIVDIGNSLIPAGFSGDKRALWDTQSKITQIVNAMGEASAHAQGLSKPITTADRLRNSEHRLYLLVDHNANNGKGAVTGMLKTGEKGLYVFDREGQHYQVSPPCVLDFYIHESRQRAGLGRRLFEHMLQKEQIEPVTMAIDRPSDKFLGFLNKHYNLDNGVKQMNNFVVFDGFFPRSQETPRAVEEDKSYTPSKKQSANGLQQGYPTSPYGRYGAPRPTCSMGQIIHNDSPVIKRNQEPSGVRSEPATNVQGQVPLNYNNQPAWQTTQSVPNMQNSYSQNSPNQMPYVYNHQNSQDQTNMLHQYPVSSGDSRNIEHPLVDNQALMNEHQARIGAQNQNNIYQNYAMAQGDATGEIYKQQGLIGATNTQHQQVQDMQSMPQMAPSSNQNSPQLVNVQGQNYYYYPQTQQYQLIEPNLSSNITYSEVQQRGQAAAVRPSVKTKEPLIPQHFDGTLRKMPHTVQSVPVQEQQNAHVVLQNSASAPINYHHQQRNNLDQQSLAQGQAYNAQVARTVHQQQINVAQTPDITPSAHQLPAHSAAEHINYQQQAKMQGHQQHPIQELKHNPANQLQMPFINSAAHQQVSMAQMANQGELVRQMNQAANEAGVIQNQQATNPNQPGAQTAQMHYNQPSAGQQNNNVLQPGTDPNFVSSNAYNELISNRNPYGGNQIMADANVQHAQSIQQVHSLSQVAPSVLNTAPPAVSQVQSVQQIQSMHHVAPEQNLTLNQNPMIPQQIQSMPHVASQQHLTLNQNPMIPQEIQSMPHVASQQNLTPNQYSMTTQQQYGGAQQERLTRQSELSGFVSNTARESYSRSHVNSGEVMAHDASEKSAQNNSTSKADRPNSLNFEPAEAIVEHKTTTIGNEQIQAETNEDEALEGDHEEDVDSLDGVVIDAIEQEIQKVEIAPKSTTPLSRGSNKSPGMEAAGLVTPGRNTPGLTDHGYFDLKFYHNKLW